MLAGLIFKPMMDKNSTNSFGASEAINEVLQLSNIADLGTKLLKALIAFFGNFGTMEIYKLSMAGSFICAPPPPMVIPSSL